MSRYLLLSAGRGPRECARALAEPLRRLAEEATRHGVRTRRVERLSGPSRRRRLVS